MDTGFTPTGRKSVFRTFIQHPEQIEIEYFCTISPVCRDLVEYPNHSQGWQIQVYFDRQGLTIKIINNIERAKRTIVNQGVMHKINRPALTQRFRCSQS